MKKLYMKQKVFSWNEKFAVKNEMDEDVYFIEGSLFKVPKTFTINDRNQTEIAQVINVKIIMYIFDCLRMYSLA